MSDIGIHLCHICIKLYLCQEKDFKSKIVTKGRGDIAKKINSSRIIIVNICTLNIKTPKCIK